MMMGNFQPSKTDAGRDEIRTRANKLPGLLRTVLVACDGAKTATQLRELAANIQAPADTLEQLANLGLITTPPAATELAPAPVAESTPVNEALAPAAPAVAPAAATAAEPAQAAEPAPPPAASPLGALVSAGNTSVAAVRFQALYRIFSDATQSLGLRGAILHACVERCTNVDDLAALTNSVADSLQQYKNKNAAAEFRTKVSQYVTS